MFLSALWNLILSWDYLNQGKPTKPVIFSFLIFWHIFGYIWNVTYWLIFHGDIRTALGLTLSECYVIWHGCIMQNLVMSWDFPPHIRLTLTWKEETNVGFINLVHRGDSTNPTLQKINNHHQQYNYTSISELPNSFTSQLYDDDWLSGKGSKYDASY